MNTPTSSLQCIFNPMRYTNANLMKYKTCYKEYTKVHMLTPTSLYIKHKGFSGKNHYLIADLYFKIINLIYNRKIFIIL